MCVSVRLYVFVKKEKGARTSRKSAEMNCTFSNFPYLLLDDARYEHMMTMKQSAFSILSKLPVFISETR